MIGWQDPAVQMPPVGLLVHVKLRHYTFGDVVKAEMKHVDDDDCAWRFDTGDELSLNYDVIRWRYMGCWLVLFLMWLGLLPGHHSHDPRLRSPEMEVWLTEEAARQRRNKILARRTCVLSRRAGRNRESFGRSTTDGVTGTRLVGGDEELRC